MAKNPSEILLQTTPPPDARRGEAVEIEELRARDQERRAQKKRRGKQRQEEREKKIKGTSGEEWAALRGRLPEAPSREDAKEEKIKEPQKLKSWEIEALEGARSDLEKEKIETEGERAKLVKEAEERDKKEKTERERGSQEAWAPRETQAEESREKFEILEIPESELAPPSRAAVPSAVEGKDERKEKWQSNVVRAIDKAYNKFEEAKFDKNQLSRLRDLQTDAERMIKAYQIAMQHGWPPLPDEESRLLKLKRDIENKLELMTEKAPKEPQTPLETEPLTGQAREEKIAAFRARRAELERKNKEEGWDSDEDFQKSGMESYDRGTAEHYNFDSQKIDEAIEEAKKVANPRYREQSIERLQRAKALIGKEIGVETSLPPRELLQEKKEDDKIKDMKGVEGAPSPESEKEPEKALQKLKEKRYTEKDSVEGWKHYIAKEEERMRREKPLTPQGEAMEAFIKREEEKKTAPPVGGEEKMPPAEPKKAEMPPEQDRDALKRKLFPEQFREPRQEAEPQAGASAAGPTQQEQQPAATAESAAQESPEMKAAIEELLGKELGRDARMREAAAAVIGARRVMREALATRREERLYAEAGAGFIAPEKLQEATRLENAYENALVGLSARLRESAKDDESFLVPYLNIQNAEAMRIAQMREAALTPERRSAAVRFYQRLNNPFNRDVPPRWARYARVGLTAAVLGGSVAALGGVGAAGIAAYAGWRASKSLTFAAVNGIARSGIDMALTRHADAIMKEEGGRQRTAMQEALKNNERIEALQESLRTSIRGFQSEAVAQLENRKFYGRAATFGLMGLSGLISYELARPSAVAADKGAFGAHIATNEDVLRQRFYGAWDRVEEGASATKQRIEDIAGNITARARELYNSGLSHGESLAKSAEEAAAKAETYLFGGKPSSEVIEDVIGKEGAGGVAGAAGKAPLSEAGEVAPSGSGIVSEDGKGFGSSEEAAALRSARGGLPPHESIEEAQKRIGGGARAGEILTDEQREEALKQYYGLIESAEKDRMAYLEKSFRYAPSDEWREEALKRYYGLVEAAEADRPPSLMTPEQAAQLHELQEKGVLTDEQIETLKRNWEGKPPLLTAEEVEKLRVLREKGVLTEEQINHARKAWEGKLEAAAKEPIATIGKGGNIWEASRSLIGEGEGKISKEQWLEAWEKSGLADKGFVKPGATVHFDAAEGLLKVSEAKDNEFLYQALQKEGKPIPGWLEDWRDAKEDRPSVADVTKETADRALARPAAPLGEVVETPVAGAKGGTFEQLLQDKAAQEYYVNSFGRHSFDQQEALLAEFKNAAERLEENIKGDIHSSVRAAYEQEVAQTKSFINVLENNARYQTNLRAWEALEKEWGRKVGVSETQFNELGDKWSVERFLDTAKKIENRDFVPSDPLSKILEARRMGTLEMAEEIRSKLPDRRALKMPLGRFLKNTL